MSHPSPSRDENDGAVGFRREGGVGALIWVLFSVVAVLLRGVRWDENYEFAQVLLGQILYPEGHPLLQCIQGVYSLQTHLLVAQMWLMPDAALANGLRNLLFLLATVLPVYAVGLILSRRAVWGHVAAVLVLLGVHVQLFGTYPIQTWPDLYSTGHIGSGYGLLTLVLFVAGFRRVAFFMAGLMVAVHLGQLPPLLAVFGLYLAMSWREGRSEELRRALLYGGLGLLPSVLLGLLLSGLAIAPPESGPYYSPIAPDDVWRGYMTHHLSHREIPWTTGHFALVGFLLLGSARAWLEYDATRSRGPWFWLTVYAGACAALVWGVMAVHSLLGADVPFLLISWMPYRLINHVSILIVPAVVAAVVGRRTFRLPALPILALLIALVTLVVGGPLKSGNLGPGPIAFLIGGEGLLFGLYGAAAARTALQLLQKPRALAVWVGLIAVGGVLLTFYYGELFVESVGPDYAKAVAKFFGPFYRTLCTVGGFVLAIVLYDRKRFWSLRSLAVLSCVAVVSVLLFQEWSTREQLPRSGFDREVRRFLEERGAGEALLLVRHQQETAQARLGHPVMTDMGAFNWIPYKPSVGPSQYKVYKDLYGVNFAPRGDEKPLALRRDGEDARMPESVVWPARSRADWRRLGEEYGFRYVIAPQFMRLDLPVALAGDREVLYDIEAR